MPSLCEVWLLAQRQVAERWEWTHSCEIAGWFTNHRPWLVAVELCTVLEFKRMPLDKGWLMWWWSLLTSGKAKWHCGRSYTVLPRKSSWCPLHANFWYSLQRTSTACIWCHMFFSMKNTAPPQFIISTGYDGPIIGPTWPARKACTQRLSET